jgi:4-oxalocrotonate tautomerase
MPLVRIHVPQGKSAEYRGAISDVIYNTTITVQVLSELRQR